MTSCCEVFWDTEFAEAVDGDEERARARPHAARCRSRAAPACCAEQRSVWSGPTTCMDKIFPGCDSKVQSA